MGILDQLTGRQPDPNADDDGGGFRGVMGNLGTALMMMDPAYQNAGIAMAKMNDDRREKRATKKAANQTAQWLTTQGVSGDEAQVIATTPELLRSWYTAWQDGKKPDWEFQTITTDDGAGEQKFWVDKKDPSKRIPVGGVKPFNPDANKPMVVGAGSTVYDPKSNKAVFTAPADDSKAPTIHEFTAKDGTTYNGQWNPTTKAWDQIDANKAPTGMTITADGHGGFTLTQGAGGGKGPSESQAKTVGYLTRMQNANKALDAYGKELTSTGNNVLGGVPYVGKAMQGQKFKLARQAGMEWLTAVLRGDSGGVIGDDEIASYGDMYLPVWGDDDVIQAQKKRARDAVELGLRRGLPPQQALMENAPNIGIGGGGGGGGATPPASPPPSNGGGWTITEVPPHG
jgi:hypothetical protein